MALAAYASPVPRMESGVADNATTSYSIAQAVPPQPADHKTCDICGRSFARREHLVRHRRTHTKEKPFSCTHCKTCFLRADVRDKHERRCSEGYRDDVQGDRPVSVRHARSRLACDSCRKRKLRCDDVQPCRSCVSKGLLCTTSTNSRRPGRPRNNSLISDPAPTPPQPTENRERIVVHQKGFEPNHSMTLEPHAQEAAPLSAYHGGPDAFNAPEFHEFNMFGMNEQDFDFMSGLWQLPTMDIESSIDDMGFTLGNEASHFLQYPTQSFDLPMDRALTMMREHFRVRSRAPSPSRVETSQRQYSAAPRLQVYDPEILNVLLNISRVHLADSFPIFSNFEAKPGMREELCLAMAAVGGLYCTVPGSAKIAKALYNDSRRLLLEAHLAVEDAQAENPLSFAMTFILLELYGISSGNKRSYEFIEVFHGAMLDAVQLYLNQVTADENQAKMLNDAVQVLASYRVLILALPPSIAKAADDEGLRQFMSPGSTTIKSGRPGIAALTALAWMVGGRKIRGFDSQLWRSDFIELALDRWMRSQQSAGGISQNLLYHMAHIFLHSDLAFLQRYAMAHGNDRVHGGLPEPIRMWTNSRDYTVARWHAEKILLPIKKAVTASYGPQRFQDRSLSSEPPHLPYCVYFSVLIGWYGSLSGNDHKAFEVTVSDGAQLLFSLKAQVAKLLGAALHELLPAPVGKTS